MCVCEREKERIKEGWGKHSYEIYDLNLFVAWLTTHSRPQNGPT
jgi:hypothetical protein